MALLVGLLHQDMLRRMRKDRIPAPAEEHCSRIADGLRMLQRHQPLSRSNSPSFVNHLVDAHGIRLNPLAQRPHSLHDFVVRQSGSRFFDRNQHCCRDPVSRDHDFFALPHPVQQLRQTRLRLKGPTEFICPPIKLVLARAQLPQQLLSPGG